MAVAGVVGPTAQGVTYTHVVKKLLEEARNLMPLGNIAQKVTVALHSGTSARFTRLLQLAPVTSAATEGTALTTVAPKAQYFDVTVAEWHNGIGVSSLLDDTFINPGLTAHAGLLGENAGLSMELEMQKTLMGSSTTDDKAGCTALVYDVSQLGTNNVRGFPTSAGTTTKLIDTKLTQAADFFKGGWINFTNPVEANYGLSRKCLAFDATADSLYWTTAVNAATSSTAPKSDYRLSSPGATSSLTAGTDVLLAPAILRARTLLHKQLARPIAGGFMVGTVDPDSEAALVGDATAVTSFTEVHKYVDNTVLLNNELGRIHGVRIVRDTHPCRLTKANPYDNVAPGAEAGDDLFVNFVLGRDCLGRCGLSGKIDTQVIVKRPGPQTTSDPSNMFCTMAWKTTHARWPINGCWGIGIVSSPTIL